MKVSVYDNSPVNLKLPQKLVFLKEKKFKAVGKLNNSLAFLVLTSLPHST